MAMDAHPGAKEETIQQISIEVFLRGIPDKDAAQSSSDKCPKTIQKALNMLKMPSILRRQYLASLVFLIVR